MPRYEYGSSMGKPNDELISIGEAARLLGVSVDTLRRWEAASKISSVRTPGNQRRYKLADIEQLKSSREDRLVRLPAPGGRAAWGRALVPLPSGRWHQQPKQQSKGENMNNDIPALTDEMLYREIARLNASLAVAETHREMDTLLIRGWRVTAEMDKRGLA